MACSYTNSRGKTYYLHKKGFLYFFSQKPEDAVEMPQGYKIVENKKTGLPLLKKE